MRSDLLKQLKTGIKITKIQNAVLGFLNNFEKIADLQAVSCYCQGAKRNVRKDLPWTQNLVREKKVYFYRKVPNTVVKGPGEYDNIAEETGFYSIAVLSQGWTLGTIKPYSSNFVWINKSSLRFSDENVDQQYSQEDEAEISKYSEVFDLLNSNLYFVSKSKSSSVEH